MTNIPDLRTPSNKFEIKYAPPENPSTILDIFTNKFTISILIINQIIVFIVAANYLMPAAINSTYNKPNSLLEQKLAIEKEQLNQQKEMHMEIKYLTLKMNDILNNREETFFNMSKWFELFEKKIRDELLLYDADKLGQIDYALETNGGTVTSLPNTTSYPSQISYKLFGGIIEIKTNSNPRVMLQAGTMPGQCYAFYGGEGRIRLGLAKFIEITAVTVEHVSQQLVEDVQSAPKAFRIYGLDHPESAFGYNLGEFVYDIEGAPLQTFKLDKPLIARTYQHIELHILSNHGHPQYTCVYRLRVHGF